MGPMVSKCRDMWCHTDMCKRATDIGIKVWQANVLGPKEVVALERLSGHFILAPATIRKVDLWITVAYDHVRPS